MLGLKFNSLSRAICPLLVMKAVKLICQMSPLIHLVLVPLGMVISALTWVRMCCGIMWTEKLWKILGATNSSKCKSLLRTLVSHLDELCWSKKIFTLIHHSLQTTCRTLLTSYNCLNSARDLNYLQLLIVQRNGFCFWLHHWREQKKLPHLIRVSKLKKSKEREGFGALWD